MTIAAPELQRSESAMPALFGRTSIQWRNDGGMLAVLIALATFGLVMVATSSVAFAQEQHDSAWYFLVRQGAFLVLGITAAALVYRVPMAWWRKLAPLLALAAFVLLILVLIPGIGARRNGSVRWLDLGVITLQASEFAKIGLVMYFAAYVAKHNARLQDSLKGMVVPLFLAAVAVALLLAEPDFGAAAVLLMTVLMMLFLAGAPLWPFILMLVALVAAMAGLAWMEEYRQARIVNFMDPWQDPFGPSYQLTMALIAIGSGGLTGSGLGHSVQKQFYLPEAHTDFVFSVLAEEFGFVGVCVLVALFAFLIWRIFRIAASHQAQGNIFVASLCQGFAVMWAIQTATNLGVNMGVLPTKGLTLPFFSYGGSSLLASCIIIGLLLRAVRELDRDELSLADDGSYEIEQGQPRAATVEGSA